MWFMLLYSRQIEEHTPSPLNTSFPVQRVLGLVLVSVSMSAAQGPKSPIMFCDLAAAAGETDECIGVDVGIYVGSLRPRPKRRGFYPFTLAETPPSTLLAQGLRISTIRCNCRTGDVSDGTQTRSIRGVVPPKIARSVERCGTQSHIPDNRVCTARLYQPE